MSIHAQPERYSFFSTSGGYFVCFNPDSPHHGKLYRLAALDISHRHDSMNQALREVGYTLTADEMGKAAQEIAAHDYQGDDCLCDCEGCTGLRRKYPL